MPCDGNHRQRECHGYLRWCDFQTFSYDPLNRLSIGASVATSGTNCWGEQYGYDAWGNLETITSPTGYSSCALPDNLNIMPTTANQISGYTYDTAGNLDTIPGTGGATYTYNAENQMTTSTAGVIYTYDGDGKRLKKSSGTVYWYGMTSDPLEETNPSGGLQNDYVFFGGERIARLDASGDIFAYFEDHLGSSRKMRKIAPGATTSTAAYDADFYPFGREHVFTSGSPIYKFTGKIRDTETGLDDFGARYDSSNLGRFLSPDPDTATPLHVINPQRWNMYAYGMNNPLSYVDPTGRDAIAVNFVAEVPLGGHEGIVVVHSDGSATYARFGPAHAARPFDKGKVTVQSLKPVQFKSDGLPTDASYKELADELGKIEGQPPSTVGFNYFKTSDADTIALQNWIDNWKTVNAPDYDVTFSNCAAFCIAGLLVGQAIENKNISLIPNRLFMLLSLVDDENWTWQGRSEPKHKRRKVAPCLKRRDGSCADQ